MPLIRKMHSPKYDIRKKRKKSSSMTQYEWDDEEITSEESDDELTQASDSFVSSDDEFETPQEKKLRLAHDYLQHVEQQETERLKGDSVGGNVVANRLKNDYLDSVGKLRRNIADIYKNADLNNTYTLKCREHSKGGISVCVSADNKFIFSGSKNGNIVKWDLILRRKVAKTAIVSVSDLAISPDGKYLAVADGRRCVHILDSTNLQVLTTHQSHKQYVIQICFERGSNIFYTCGKDLRDHLVKVWYLENNNVFFRETLCGHTEHITSIDTSYRDKIVTSGGSDGSIRLWNIPAESHRIYSESSGNVDVVRFINKEYFVSGTSKGNLCLWYHLKKKPICAITQAHGCDPDNGKPYWIVSIAALWNRDVIASGSNNGFVKVWKLCDGIRSISLLFLIPATGFVNSMCFGPNGNELVVATSKEHRLGRWTVVKSARNEILVVPLLK